MSNDISDRTDSIVGDAADVIAGKINLEDFRQQWAPAPERRPVDTPRIAAGEGETLAGDKAAAASIIESIGRDFVKLRAEGRSPAWAELEDRLMASAHILISSGLMSPKDWIGLAIDIEQFRKQDLGTTQLPGDFLKQWLSEPTEDVKVPQSKHIPKRERKKEKKTA